MLLYKLANAYICIVFITKLNKYNKKMRKISPDSMRQKLINMEIGQIKHYNASNVESVRSTIYLIQKKLENRYTTKMCNRILKVTRIA